MNEMQWEGSANQAQAALQRALATTDPSQAVTELSDVIRAVETALSEAMAAAVLAGTSMRKVAEAAGIAPNSVPPRLARSTPLAAYVASGASTADAIVVARHDAATGRSPMTFKPRRKEQS